LQATSRASSEATEALRSETAAIKAEVESANSRLQVPAAVQTPHRCQEPGKRAAIGNDQRTCSTFTLPAVVTP